LTPDDKRYVQGYHLKDPWADVRVREAMNIAIDRNAICKAIYSGAAKPATIDPMIPGWEELKPIPYNVERAKRLLAEAGYPNGFSLTIRAYTQGGSPEQPMVCEAAAAFWEKIGIKTKIIQTEYAATRPLTTKGNWAGELLPFAGSWLGDYTLRLVSYHVPNQARTFFQSPELTALFRKLVPEIDEKKRNDIWKEIAKNMRDDYTSISMVVTSQIFARDKKKVGKWPQSQSELLSPAYIRHAKPLNTWRLFEID
jgi:ABC-type transport system substrate-binding protein